MLNATLSNAPLSLVQEKKEVSNTSESLCVFPCWNIFSNVTLKYELYGPSQIKEITNRLNLPFTHGDIISLVDKVRIIGIKDNDIDWKEKEIQNTFFVHKYLEEFNYYIPIQQDPKANDLHHSVSWTSSLKVT